MDQSSLKSESFQSRQFGRRGFLTLDAVEIGELRSSLSREEVGQGFTTVEDGKA